MSRIGKKPIPIPPGVDVKIEGDTVKVKGPKGELSQQIRPEVDVKIEDNQIIVTRKSDNKKARAFHGLYRSLINNMVIGVTSGFTKVLEIHGTGYRASIENVQGETCVVFKKGELGYSHPIYFAIPAGMEVSMEGRTKIILKGIDKSLVGLVAAKIRALRPPDPYKGKGIRYEGETIQLKVGKKSGS